MSPLGSLSVTNMLAQLVRRMFVIACEENKFMLLQMKGLSLGDGTGPAEESKKDKTRPGMVSSNWVRYIVCNTL